MGKYITNLAQSFIGQLGAAVKIEDTSEFLAQNLHDRHSKAIHTLLRRMRPETLGRIAACGGGCDEDNKMSQGITLYQVHCGAYLNKYADGISLLREIACTAIIAEMANILYRP
jgi:hypothetical protein